MYIYLNPHAFSHLQFFSTKMNIRDRAKQQKLSDRGIEDNKTS